MRQNHSSGEMVSTDQQGDQPRRRRDDVECSNEYPVSKSVLRRSGDEAAPEEGESTPIETDTAPAENKALAERQDEISHRRMATVLSGSDDELDALEIDRQE